MALDLEGSSEPGGSPARFAKLQPLNYAANLVAAYAFNEPGVECDLDRSGHGRNFSLGNGDTLASEMANVMDLVPGKGAIIPSGPETWYSAPNKCVQHDAAWQLEGEMTITMRFWNVTPSGLATIVPVSFYPTFPASIAGIFYIGADAKLHYYAENNKAPLNFVSTNAVCTPNHWSFLSMRRDAAGVVTLGCGTGPRPSQQVYDTSGPMAPPSQSGPTSGWAAHFLRYEVDASPSGGGGALADFVCWNRRLSDAELMPQYGTAMVGADRGF